MGGRYSGLEMSSTEDKFELLVVRRLRQKAGTVVLVLVQLAYLKVDRIEQVHVEALAVVGSITKHQQTWEQLTTCISTMNA